MEEINFKVNAKDLDSSITIADITFDSSNEMSAIISHEDGPSSGKNKLYKHILTQTTVGSPSLVIISDLDTALNTSALFNAAYENGNIINIFSMGLEKYSILISGSKFLYIDSTQSYTITELSFSFDDIVNETITQL